MNDTINQLNKRQELILLQLRRTPKVGSSTIFEQINLFEPVSLITIKRDMTFLMEGNFLKVSGRASATTYSLTSYGLLNTSIDISEFINQEPDTRAIFTKYNFELFAGVDFELFNPSEINILEEAGIKYLARIKNSPPQIAKKELERFIIEFAWKSSVIEGNTYNLLETERLIVEQIEAVGKSDAETIMILNHKKALDFVLANLDSFKVISPKFIIKIHEIVADGLDIPRGIRGSLVGITGSGYRPLDNRFQIEEALIDLCSAINKQANSASKALLSILGISYIQPFVDGNKRTSRLIGNAILLAVGAPPLSYRSVNVDDYRAAMLVFYELNTLVPFKKIFTEQYLFSADNYLVG